MKITIKRKQDTIHDEVLCDEIRLRDFMISEVEKLHPEVKLMMPNGCTIYTNQTDEVVFIIKYKE